MNDLHNIKKLLRPLFYGWYLIVVSFVVSIMLVMRLLNYTSPVYQSTVKLKLDDLYEGVSNSNLFKDFDVFSTSNKILGEVEVIKSKVLIEKTLEKLDFDVSYYRLGTMAKKEIYHDSPFQVFYSNMNEKGFDRPYVVELGGAKKTLKYMVEEVEHSFAFAFNDTLSTPMGDFLIIEREIEKCDENPQACQGIFEFNVHSMNQQINSIIGSNLTVMEIDKDVAIVRITYKSEVAEKSALFSNKLAEVYINDFIQSKIKAAGKTIDFVSERLDNVGKRLEESEKNLEQYRLNNRVVNLLQESETGLRQVSQMKLQLANLESEARTLDTLYQYTREGSGKILEMAPSFGSVGGLLYTEMVKTLRGLEATKKDLLLKYKPHHEDIVTINAKIADLEHYMLRNIENHRNEIMIKIKGLKEYLDLFESQFDNYATKEKNVIVLERKFKQDEKIYNFLTEKKTEAEIVQHASIAFHRIIEYAKVPKAPVSPNRKFMVIVGGFLGLIVGVFLAFTRSYVLQRVYDKADVEKSLRPIIPLDEYAIRKPKDYLFIGWKSWSLLKHHLKNSSLEGVLYLKNAGKHNEAERMAKSLQEAMKSEEKKVCILSLSDKSNFLNVLEENPSSGNDQLSYPKNGLPLEALTQTKRFNDTLDKLKEQYELVILITDKNKSTSDMELVKNVTYTLVIAKNRKTSKKVINAYETYFGAYSINNMAYALVKDNTGWHHKVIDYIKKIW